MQPQPRELPKIISPASTDAHAIDGVPERQIFEYHLREFDGKNGEWVDGLGW
jgi:hypothetical protein